ncbi:STAS-like domain-containing protein [Bacteroides pyogenes]|uniref:STAS-like domain-containing protein n=1 Tax=Bacteroides pyogenes TaxID=310300 RepID=UPI001BAD6D74|nr:STAS-like domain-containing protein [Bacteroides pyogenes]MBR8707105.1 hypothetical protein [Bacteroides pyogenes]
MYMIKLYDVMSGRDFPDAGRHLHDLMVDNANSDKIIINLDGVSLLPSMFLNVSIGRFIDRYGVEYLKRKISFINITKSQAERMKEYIDRYSN